MNRLSGAIFAMGFCISVHANDLASDLRETLQRAETSTLAKLQNGDHWNMPLYMGTHYVSQYFLMRFWLTQDPRLKMESLPPFDNERLREILLRTQRKDGSWLPVPDPLVKAGGLDATILNYWALKVIGKDKNTEAMNLAQQFIVNAGGIEKASAFLRIFAAMFGQLSWWNTPWTPLFFINPYNPSVLNIEEFPQWVRPHIVPITYLDYFRVQRDLGEQFDIRELHVNGETPPLDMLFTHRPSATMSINTMLTTQNPLGSWGGYTLSTLFTVAALDDYLVTTRDGVQSARIRGAMLHGIDYINKWLIGDDNPAAYLGAVCDGRYWDTILVMQGLSTFDPNFAAREAVTSYLEKAQTANGGIPFGVDFEATPDLDDTAEYVTTLELQNPDAHAHAIEQAMRWLTKMQNSGGGWGAFDQNNDGNFLLRAFTRGLSDSATLFDPSTPDVTGHALEAFGAANQTLTNSEPVQKAIAYIRGSVTKNGTWSGRWGVNYIYGTSAVISGLLRVHMPATDPLIQKGLLWIEDKQNLDGGFGESTNSYLTAATEGRGISTPSQTAWALMAMVRAGHAGSFKAKAAVDYLMRTVSPEGTWQDNSVVGTGHPGLIYLVYPSYPVAFPMIALAEYLRALQ